MIFKFVLYLSTDSQYQVLRQARSYEDADDSSAGIPMYEEHRYAPRYFGSAESSIIVWSGRSRGLHIPMTALLDTWMYICVELKDLWPSIDWTKWIGTPCSIMWLANEWRSIWGWTLILASLPTARSMISTPLIFNGSWGTSKETNRWSLFTG